MSAQKQCPKCGEKNPAEAVMCWACYTSLTGSGAPSLAGAAAATAVAGGPAAAAGHAPISDTGEKKKIDPKLLGVVGVGLLAALGFGVKTMMGGTPPDEPLLGGDMPAPKPAPQPQPAAQSQPAPGPAPVGGNIPPSPADVKAVEGGKAPYNMVSTPNPRYLNATAVIVTTQNDVNLGIAKGIAGVAFNQIQSMKKFGSVEIFVFNDTQSAQVLANYQSQQNRGAPMQPADYQAPALAEVWPKVLVRYVGDAKGGKSYSYPASNPAGFWKQAKL